MDATGPKLEIVFQNDHFVVIDKDPEVLSVPSRMGKDETRPIAGILLEKRLGRQIYPVHRLDFEVSGLLLFAKNPEAHRVASHAFENHLVQKTYQAYLAPTQHRTLQNLRWQDKLFRGKKRTFIAEHGKESITDAKKLQGHPKEKWELWELKPLTGRSHQLRFHCSHHASAIVGDKLYGSQEKWQAPGIALRAITLEVPESLVRLGLPQAVCIPSFDSAREK